MLIGLNLLKLEVYLCVQVSVGNKRNFSFQPNKSSIWCLNFLYLYRLEYRTLTLVNSGPFGHNFTGNHMIQLKLYRRSSHVNSPSIPDKLGVECHFVSPGRPDALFTRTQRREAQQTHGVVLLFLLVARRPAAMSAVVRHRRKRLINCIVHHWDWTYNSNLSNFYRFAD